MSFDRRLVSSVRVRVALPLALAFVAIGCGGATPASVAPTVASAAPSVASEAPSAASASPSAASASPSAAAGKVTAALSQFKVELGASSAPAGSVTFDVTNNGSVEHEFVVFKTDLAADKLPLTADGTMVDEEGTGVSAIDEIAEFAPGTTESLTVDLPAGKYVVICNVPTHYTKGMRAEFSTGS